MNHSQPDQPPIQENASFRDIATDAIRYWEPRRLLYNAFWQSWSSDILRRIAGRMGSADPQ